MLTIMLNIRLTIMLTIKLIIWRRGASISSPLVIMKLGLTGSSALEQLQEVKDLPRFQGGWTVVPEPERVLL